MTKKVYIRFAPDTIYVIMDPGNEPRVIEYNVLDRDINTCSALSSYLKRNSRENILMILN